MCLNDLRGEACLFRSEFSYLFDSIQHALAPLPRLGVLPDAAQTGHAVPLPVLQLSVEGVGQQQHSVINVAVGDLRQKKGETERR